MHSPNIILIDFFTFISSIQYYKIYFFRIFDAILFLSLFISVFLQKYLFNNLKKANLYLLLY